MPTRLGLELRVRVHEIVCLEVIGVVDEKAERREELRDEVPLLRELVGHRRALRVVRRVGRGAIRRRLGTEAQDHRAWLHGVDDGEQRGRGAEERVVRHALRDAEEASIKGAAGVSTTSSGFMERACHGC